MPSSIYHRRYNRTVVPKRVAAERWIIVAMLEPWSSLKFDRFYAY
jgi:hypothetical protein